MMALMLYRPVPRIPRFFSRVTSSSRHPPRYKRRRRCHAPEAKADEPGQGSCAGGFGDSGEQIAQREQAQPGKSAKSEPGARNREG